MPKTLIREATTGALGQVSEKGVVPIVVASPGWGSSGWYGAQVLENAVDSHVFVAGTHLYMDHPGEAELYDRPERSVRDLVAVLESDATWDAQQGIVAQAKVFAPYRDLFRDEDFVGAIGVSMRAYADTTVGEAEGRKGTIITALLEARSVDFVTKAGRGGKVLSVLESARQDAHEALSGDVREILDLTVQAANAPARTYVVDFDVAAGQVIYRRIDQDDENGYRASMWRDGYTLADDGAASLAGSPVEVRARTEYVPVTSPPNAPAPAGQSTATESKETNMATTQIEEAELGRLRQDAERASTLESERDTAQRERDEAREVLAVQQRTTAANTVIDAAEATFTPLERRGLLAELPVTEAGDLDEAAFTTTVTEAAAARAAADGAGSIRGFGRTDHTDTNLIAEAEKAAAGAFGRHLKEA